MKRIVVVFLAILLLAGQVSGSQSLRILMLGPPGSGKSTQAHQLERIGLFYLSPADLVEEQIHQDTELGQEASVYTRAGQAVPDATRLAMVKEQLRTHTDFVIDGFPRTPEQARALDEVLAQLGRPLNLVVDLVVDDAVLKERLAQRRYCPVCARTYNLALDPPRNPGRCDDDAAELKQSPEDLPDAVSRRLDVYRQENGPVLDYYRSRGLVETVAGDASVEAVSALVRRPLQRKRVWP